MKKINNLRILTIVSFLFFCQYTFAQLPLIRKATTTSTLPSGTAASIVTENNNKVGIGIVAPAAKLTIASDGSTIPYSLEVSNRAYSVFPTSGLTGSSGTFTGYNPISFAVNRIDLGGRNGITQYNITDFMVNSSGNVGIGTTTPTERLQVVGNIATIGINISNSLVNNGTTQLSGNTTVGTTTANANLTVNGNTTMNGNLTITNGTLRLSNGSNQYSVGSDGKVRARQVKVDLDVIPDYVFDKSYKLLTFEEIEAYIAANKHLPGVKSESEYKAEGSIDLAELNLKLLEKVEELTLYLLQQEKRIKELETAIVNPK